ncbi:MAG TPA: septum formation protein Maf [Candidatus Faeciplasma pullistercoris]|uniref:dTTP/UTP pyrophosphatase n=1 Tax=Candidatus Faeciplasma pullistercoris TaxID=2840800 RepID=A0A9D1GTX0_9FIRM|nr:septum formation protein Maf [Candidatus Faeciplasma pullistercoris]
MSSAKIKYLLASQSPRRAELMKYITDEFEILPSDCDETVPDGIEPEEIPELLAARKALSVSRLKKNRLVIGCDTVVIIDGVILGKPHTPDRAISMLKTLSGRTHTVVSGVCICYKGKTMSFSQKTLVSFYELFEEEIRDYVQSCKPLDKAGAYGIQDKGGLFVREISGDYYNIVGLPVARLKREIDKLVSICERE